MMTKYVETTTSADTAAWMGRALAAEKQLAAAVARAEAAEGDAAYWQSVHADNEAYALAKFREYGLELAALRAQLADIMAGDAYRYVREHPEIDAAIDDAFGLPTPPGGDEGGE